jgi:hypothetical protein
MKEIYSFDVSRKVESSKPVAKKVKGVTVESVEKSIKEIKHRVVFAKPSMSMIEEAEFFYGQKFNELINAGFFTKAMLNKKMGDIGGLSSKTTIESLQKAISDNMEASRVIEFYGASNTLSDEQKEKLEEAKLIFSSSKSQVIDYEQAVRSQFSQTADVKAEQKLIEWLVFNLSYYEDDVDAKKELFPLFEGDTFEDKRSVYLELCETLEDIENPNLYKAKAIFDEAFKVLVRVASIWYNKIAEKPEDIKKAMDEMFGDENGDPIPEVAATLEAEETKDGEKGES